MSRKNCQQGFTLIEMLVATAAFAIIGGAALALVANQTPIFNRQQNFSGLNIGMRNAVAQLQIDVVNAGTGFYPGTNIPDWPVGVTIVNNTPASACNTPATFTYSATCFDTLNLITTDPNTPAAHPDNGTFSYTGADCVDTDAGGTMYVAPITGLATTNYVSGDQLLLVDTANSKMTTIKLTSAGSAHTSGGVTGIGFSYSATSLTATGGLGGVNTAAHDPLSITTCQVGTSPCPLGSFNPKINNSFCSTDWIMRLQPVTYSVDTTTASDPKLTRTVAGTSTVLAEQVIGFKVGAVAWNTTDDTQSYSYCASNAYNANWPTSGSCSGYSNNWWLIRSVQLSVIGRTTPVTDPTYTYRNGFDGGPYQIESEMTVINPRNMSMNNQ